MTTTDDRHTLAELAELGGWHRRDVDRTDYYAKGIVRVQVIWQGTGAITGGSLYHDDIMTAYSREISTVRSWLRR
jgi:hypothetical protein